MPISYTLTISVLTLLVVSWYAGQLAHAFLNPYLTQVGIDASRFVTAPVAFIAVMVLGILLFTARTTYNEREANLEDVAAKAITLNRQLFYYGPGGNEAHNELRKYVTHLIENRPYAVLGDPDKSKSEPLVKAVEAMPVNPKDSKQVADKARIADTLWSMTESRMHLATKSEQSVYTPSVLLVTGWLCLIFFNLGATSPWGNRALMIYGFLAATCVASSTYLLAEWQSPYSGMIQLSDRPLNAILKSLDNTEGIN